MPGIDSIVPNFAFHNCPPPPDQCTPLFLEAYKALKHYVYYCDTAPAIDKAVVEALEGQKKQKEDIIQFLFRALMHLSPKHDLAKKITTSLQKLVTDNWSIYTNSVSQVTQELSNSNDETSFNVDMVNTFAEFPDYIFPKFAEEDINNRRHKTEAFIQLLFHSLHKKIDSLWHRIVVDRIVIVYWNAKLARILKNLLIILQREKCSEVTKDCWNDLLPIFITISSHDDTVIDIRISSGIIILHICNHLSTEPNLLYKIIQGQFTPLKNLPIKGRLSIYHGVLCLNTFCDEKLSVFHISSVFLNLPHYLDCSENESHTILYCKIYNLFFIKLRECLPLSTETLEQIMFNFSIDSSPAYKLREPIWHFWDYHLDSVKHQAREIFQSYLKFSEYLDSSDLKQYCVSLSQYMVQQLSYRKVAYSALRCLIPYTHAVPLLDSVPSLPATLVKQLKDPAYASLAKSLLEDLFTLHSTEVFPSTWQSMWFPAFFLNYTEDMLTYGYEDLLNKFLGIPNDGAHAAINYLLQFSSSSNRNLSLLILCSKNILFKKKQDALSTEFIWKGILPYSQLLKSLKSFNPSLKNLAFSLLCENPKSTALFEEKELTLLAEFICDNLNNQIPSFRQRLSTNFGKMLRRINKGIAVIRKGNKENSSHVFKIHEEFVRNLFYLLLDNLHPNANFCRIKTTLNLLELLQEILFSEDGSFTALVPSLVNKDVVDTLIIHLDNSFLDNREIVLQLLMIYSPLLKEQRLSVNEALLNSAVKLASSTRPADAITASFIIKFITGYHQSSVPLFEKQLGLHDSKKNCKLLATKFIISKLQEELKVAQESILQAASKGPMYGLILCLRDNLAYYRIKLDNYEGEWKILVGSILDMCLEIASLTSPIIKHNAPEGNFPTDPVVIRNLLQKSFSAVELGFRGAEMEDDLNEEEIVKAHAICAQMVLLCGWRCIKEIALLLGQLTTFAPFSVNQISYLSFEQVEKMKDLFVTLLIETKHRGAFEQTYHGFKDFCGILAWSKDDSFSKIPLRCLRSTMDKLKDPVERSKMATTRRSGGIPYIVQAILLSLYHTNSVQVFQETMDSIYEMNLAEKEPSFHGCNINRSLIREKKLGNMALAFCARGIDFALNAYKSNDWNLKQTAALLFAALICRMFGPKKEHDDLSSKNSMSAKLFFENYPELYDTIRTVLPSYTEINKPFNSNLYLILLLLGKISPSMIESKDSTKDVRNFIPGILICCTSPDIRVRTLAARALVPLISPIILKKVLDDLFYRFTLKDQNELHGALLFTLELLNAYHVQIGKNLDLKKEIAMEMATHIWIINKSNPCFVTRDIGFRVFNTLYAKKIVTDPSTIKAIKDICEELLRNHKEANYCFPGYVSAMRMAAVLFYEICKNKLLDMKFLQLMTFHPVSEVRYYIWQCIQSFTYFTHLGANLVYKHIVALKTQHQVYYYKMFKVFASLVLSKYKFFTVDQVREVFNLNQEYLNEEYNDEILSSLIESSSDLTCFLLKNEKDCRTEFRKTLQVLLNYSSYEGIFSVRLTVAMVLEKFQPLAGTIMEENDLLMTFETYLNLLTDDDTIVKEASLAPAHRFLKLYYPSFAKDEDVYFTPELIVKGILQFFLAQRVPSYLALFFEFALKEEEEDLFGLSQDDDRLFEKGEINIYREEFQHLQLASKAYTAVFAKRPMSADLFIDGQRLAPYLLFNLENNGGNDTITIPDQFSVFTFVEFLVKDLEFILDHLKTLPTEPPFLIPHYDHWFCRLACRALLYSTIKGSPPSELFPQVSLESLLVLHNSLIKPKIFGDILAWLS